MKRYRSYQYQDSVRREIPFGPAPDLLRLELRGHKHVVDDVRAVDCVYGLLPADHVKFRPKKRVLLDRQARGHFTRRRVGVKDLPIVEAKREILVKLLLVILGALLQVLAGRHRLRMVR